MIDWQKLIDWFGRQKRDLPWRNNPDPYAVWVSEIMLQQTQVSVVVPYFNKWMKRFPTLEKLAEASLNDVMKLWEGLGYYSRARCLHEGAKFVLSHYNGQIPSISEELKKIKGLGPYTIGAILSFAFHHKVAAVDGNVLRVISRYFMMEDDVSKARTLKTIRELVQEILPDHDHWLANEGLIELGATICSRNPNCSICPLKETCKSYLHGQQHQYPKSSKKSATEAIYRCVAVIFSGDFVLLQKGKKGGVMADLYEFPYFDTDKGGIGVEQASRKVLEVLGLNVNFVRDLTRVSHSFTRYRAHLTPILFNVSDRNQIDQYNWHSRDELKNLPFSSGHRRVLEQLS